MAVGSIASERRTLSAKDEGKRVVTPNGETVGEVTRVVEGKALVTPSIEVLDGLGPCLYDAWKRCAPFELEPREVERIDSAAVVLKSATASRRFSRD